MVRHSNLKSGKVPPRLTDLKVAQSKKSFRTCNRGRYVVRIDFVSPGEEDDDDHDEAEKEAGDRGRHHRGRGQEEAVIDAEGSFRNEVHDHGEQGSHESDDDSLKQKRVNRCTQGLMMGDKSNPSDNFVKNEIKPKKSTYMPPQRYTPSI